MLSHMDLGPWLISRLQETPDVVCDTGKAARDKHSGLRNFEKLFYKHPHFLALPKYSSQFPIHEKKVVSRTCGDMYEHYLLPDGSKKFICNISEPFFDDYQHPVSSVNDSYYLRNQAGRELELLRKFVSFNPVDYKHHHNLNLYRESHYSLTRKIIDELKFYVDYFDQPVTYIMLSSYLLKINWKDEKQKQTDQLNNKAKRALEYK